MELLATSSADNRRQLLSRFVSLSDAVGDRFRVLAPLPVLIKSEWQRSTRVTYFSRDDLIAVIKGDVDEWAPSSALMDIRADFIGFKERQQAEIATKAAKILEYQKQPRVLGAAESALRAWRAPEAYVQSRDRAEDVMCRYARLPIEAFAPALEQPDAYLSTWTFALLIRMWELVRILPADDRPRILSECGFPLLKLDRNDLMDAAIAASAASCGFIITDDDGLATRIRFLHERQLIRLQAFSSEQVAANWREPVLAAKPAECST
jgi:hypothetical protein